MLAEQASQSDMAAALDGLLHLAAQPPPIDPRQVLETAEEFEPLLVGDDMLGQLHALEAPRLGPEGAGQGRFDLDPGVDFQGDRVARRLGGQRRRQAANLAEQFRDAPPLAVGLHIEQPPEGRSEPPGGLRHLFRFGQQQRHHPPHGLDPFGLLGEFLDPQRFAE